MLFLTLLLVKAPTTDGLMKPGIVAIMFVIPISVPTQTSMHIHSYSDSSVKTTTRDLHCVQKKTPTHIFFHISMNYLWILTKIAVNIPKD